jgi:hypothetical protein
LFIYNGENKNSWLDRRFGTFPFLETPGNQATKKKLTARYFAPYLNGCGVVLLLKLLL